MTPLKIATNELDGVGLPDTGSPMDQRSSDVQQQTLVN
jgi:hypothetical protein